MNIPAEGLPKEKLDGLLVSAQGLMDEYFPNDSVAYLAGIKFFFKDDPDWCTGCGQPPDQCSCCPECGNVGDECICPELCPCGHGDERHHCSGCGPSL